MKIEKMSCELCPSEKPIDRTSPWVCDKCIIVEKDLGMKTLENSVLSKEIVELLTAVYEVLPEDKLSMEARDFIIELNDLDDPIECCIGLTDILACLDNWHGKEAEIAKMKIEAEYERLWNAGSPASTQDLIQAFIGVKH